MRFERWANGTGGDLPGDFADLPTPPHRPRHTAVMAVRFGVHADTERECQAALELLCASLGLEPALYPRQVTDDRWMARAVPAQTKAPAGESGRGPVVSG